MKYDYETLTELRGVDNVTVYRIRDVASDNAICRTYDELNAKLVVRALNALGVEYMSYMRRQVAKEMK